MSIKMSFLLRNLCNKNTIKLVKNSVITCANTSNTFFNRNIYILSSNSNNIVLKKTCCLNNNVPARMKYNKSGKNVPDDEGSDSEDESFDNSIPDDKDNKLIKVKVNSLRTDLILKAGLGLARNKVETCFYESKIRVNGKKIFKKSAQLSIGDEIDVIKGPSSMNPEHLVVARVEILSAVVKNETILTTLRRTKSLVIENYESENVWKNSEQ